MFELPDRRAVWWMLGVIAVMFAHVVAITVDEQGSFARASEFTMFAGIAVLGAALAHLSIQDGFSVMRPSRTREDRPFLFWTDVLVLCPGLPLAAAWMAWDAYTR